MVMRQIPDDLDTGTSGSSKTLNHMMTGHEPVAHGCHPMFANDTVMIEHAALCGVAGGDEEVVATAVNQAALEPSDGRTLEERFGLKRKGLLQRRITLRDLIFRGGSDQDFNITPLHKQAGNIPSRDVSPIERGKGR